LRQLRFTEVFAVFDGFVAEYMGDGVLIYFGYPQTHGDGAERAGRDGASSTLSVASMSTPASSRRDRHSGLPVVGYLIGEASAREQYVVGETPNLAARRQTLAGLDAVVIARVRAAGRRSGRRRGQGHRSADARWCERPLTADPTIGWAVIKGSSGSNLGIR
jgi:class 3 adenylate cyclase